MAARGKFLGETKGNKTNPINVSDSALGTGESHKSGAGLGGKFAGGTPGNSYANPNKSTGVTSKRKVAGGSNAC